MDAPQEKAQDRFIDQFPQAPLVELASGVSVRPDLIMFIARAELNKYLAFFPQCPATPNLTGDDLDILRSLGVLQRIRLVDEKGEEVKLGAANDPKIAVAK